MRMMSVTNLATRFDDPPAAIDGRPPPVAADEGVAFQILEPLGQLAGDWW